MTNALLKTDFVEESDYRSESSYSASDLKLETKTNGFTLWDYKFNPNTRKKPDTPALKIGRMIHKAKKKSWN